MSSIKPKKIPFRVRSYLNRAINKRSPYKPLAAGLWVDDESSERRRERFKNVAF